MESIPTLFITKKPLRGFTLIEMLVVLSIIVVITAVVITGQSSYNRSLLLTDTAYTVAYSIRQAQSLGLASRGTSVGGSVVTNAGYGVNFTGGIATSYTVFADTGGSNPPPPSVCPLGTSGTPDFKRGNCKYDAGTDTIIQNYTFSRGFTIRNLRGKQTTGGSYTQLSSVDVVFMRPETRAILIGPAPSYTSYSCVQMDVTAPGGGDIRTVRVSQLGEISVGQNCP